MKTETDKKTTDDRTKHHRVLQHLSTDYLESISAIRDHPERILQYLEDFRALVTAVRARHQDETSP